MNSIRQHWFRLRLKLWAVWDLLVVILKVTACVVGAAGGFVLLLFTMYTVAVWIAYLLNGPLSCLVPPGTQLNLH